MASLAPPDLEPLISAYLERHGPTKRVDLARAIEAEWLGATGRALERDVMVKVKKALTHMERRGSVQPSGVFGVWQLVGDDGALESAAASPVEHAPDEAEEAGDELLDAHDGNQRPVATARRRTLLGGDGHYSRPRAHSKRQPKVRPA